MHRKYCYIFIFSLLYPFYITAQPVKRLNTFRYSINEGLLQSHVIDMAFDKYGFGWLSFSNGLQKFNGKSFETIAIQDGLPDDKNINLARVSNGDLYFFGTKAISWYNADKNSFSIIQDLKNPGLSITSFLGEVKGILYFYYSGTTIAGIDINSRQVVFEQSFKTRAANFENLSQSYVIHDKIFFSGDLGLYRFDAKSRLVTKIESATSLPLTRGFYVENDETTITYILNANKQVKLSQFNTATGTFALKKELLPGSPQLERFSIYKSANTNLLSAYNNVYELNSDFSEIKYRWLNFQNLPCAGNSLIDNIRTDNYGNIYLLTVNDGFRKVISKNLPIKYFGIPGQENNNVISMYADKEENVIIAGTFGKGLLVFDTSQQLKFHLQNLPGGETDFSISSIIKQSNESYLLFQFNSTNTWIFNTHDYSIRKAAIKKPAVPFGFFGNTVFNDNKTALVVNEETIYKWNSTHAATLNFLKHDQKPFYGSMFYKNELLAGNSEFLVFYDTGQLKIRRKIDVNQAGAIRCLAKDREENIFLGCIKGLMKIDSTGKNIWKLDKKDGLPDDCIYSIQQDAGNNIWCSTNKGIFKLTPDKNILVLRKEDGLQENEFNTNISFQAKDGEMFFGGVNGISSFYPGQINSAREKLDILITDIKIDGEPYFIDTAVWNMATITLPYNKNNISINFTAIGGGNPDQYVYQYKMDGVDGNWNLDNLNGIARYTLQPGTFYFKMYASKSFDKNARPLKELKIIITAPFWKRSWFILFSCLLIIGIIAFNINRYNRRKFNKKLNQVREQQRVQEERDRISKELHDNIGVQANAILHNATLLNTTGSNNEYLADNLKETAKLMLVNLRETLWAMKSSDIAAVELWLRIINFMKQMGRHYTSIGFKVEGTPPEGLIIPSNKALNIVLVLQELVNNAIKHADAAIISAISSYENNIWTISVKDDGKGFNLTAAGEKKESYGLANIAERAANAGFTVDIDTEPGKGTTTCMKINN